MLALRVAGQRRRISGAERNHLLGGSVLQAVLGGGTAQVVLVGGTPVGVLSQQVREGQASRSRDLVAGVGCCAQSSVLLEGL